MYLGSQKPEDNPALCDLGVIGRNTPFLFIYLHPQPVRGKYQTLSLELLSSGDKAGPPTPGDNLIDPALTYLPQNQGKQRGKPSDLLLLWLGLWKQGRGSPGRDSALGWLLIPH